MREHKRDKGRLEDIRQYALNVEKIIEGITFDEFVGDYIAIAKSDMVLIYRERDECHYPGQHAGICDDEIYVPIIVAYKNKEAQVKQG